jgi:hypothetical protein
VTGGSGAALTVTLNGSATVAAVDALIQNLTYADASNSPTASRTLVLNVVDGAGAELAGFGAGYSELTGSANPFASFAVPTRSVLASGDVDGDGDADLVVAGNDGNFTLIRNDGAGSFTRTSGGANPFSGINNGILSTPALVDVNGDGRLDLVAAGEMKGLRTFINNGNGGFAEVTGAANPFNGLGAFHDAAAAFADIDNDGDVDLVVGEYSGIFHTYKNVGGVFTEVTGAADPLNGFTVGSSHAKPAFVDFDGDGDLDLVSGSFAGSYSAFRNNGDGSFTQLAGTANPFAGINGGLMDSATFVDVTGDGRAEMVTGADSGGLRLFKLAAGAPVTVNVTAVNDLPTVSAPIADTVTHPGTAFSYAVAANAFADPDSALTYSASLSGGGALPTWLSFDAATRTFSGTPGMGDVANLQVVVTANDGFGSVSDTFVLAVTPSFSGAAAIEAFTGTASAELIVGGGGGDTLSGGGGNDTIYGGAYGELGPSPSLPSSLTATAQSYYSHDHALVNGLGGSQGFGENVLAKNDDGFTGAISLTSVFGAQGLNFFGTNYTSLSVNNNGNITFNGGYGTYIPAPIAPTGLPPILAIFWADIDTQYSGGLLPAGAGNSRGTDLVYYDLDTVNHVFTATWDDVGAYNDGTIPNAFQLQLIDRGNGDFDIIYRYEDINWINSSSSGLPRVGYSSGSGVAFELPGSGTSTMASLDSTVGNTGIAGVWVFQVRNGQVSNGDNDTIDGGAGADTLIGGGGNDIFVFRPGEANGDHVLDFNGFGGAAGDSLRFVGYGAGATFTQIDATHWQVNYNGGASHDIITFDNAPPIDVSDWVFA